VDLASKPTLKEFRQCPEPQIICEYGELRLVVTGMENLDTDDPFREPGEKAPVYVIERQQSREDAMGVVTHSWVLDRELGSQTTDVIELLILADRPKLSVAEMVAAERAEVSQ
jgi:hypothetical protein